MRTRCWTSGSSATVTGLRAHPPRPFEILTEIDLRERTGAGLLLPCTVAVRVDDQGTVVEALDPAVLVQATGIVELEPVATEARTRLTTALRAVAAAKEHSDE